MNYVMISKIMSQINNLFWKRSEKKYIYIYLRSDWKVSKMIMWESQDQEISSSKWVHEDHASSNLSLRHFIMKTCRDIIIIIIHTRFDIDLSRLMREMLYTTWNRRKIFKKIKIFHNCLVRATTWRRFTRRNRVFSWWNYMHSFCSRDQAKSLETLSC